MMKKMAVKGILKMVEVRERVSRVLKNEEGQGGGEYGMILVLILVVMIPLLVLFRNQISNVIETITNSVATR